MKVIVALENREPDVTFRTGSHEDAVVQGTVYRGGDYYLQIM
jgi:hypothetical protein